MARIKVPIDVDEDITAAARVVKQAEKRALTDAKANQKTKKAYHWPKLLSWSKSHRILYTGVLLSVVLITWLIVSNIRLHRQLRQATADPQLVVDHQNAVLVKRVGKLTDLPQDETPLIATVSDADKAKSQSSFFTVAENGDKVLQYTKASKLILYRPGTDKVVQVGSINAKP